MSTIVKIQPMKVTLLNGVIRTTSVSKQGVAGIQGEQGIQGIQGEQGIAGKNGVDGISAYQSYLNTTTDVPPLTEAEWSASYNPDDASETTKGISNFPMIREAVASSDTVTSLETGDEVLIKRIVAGVPTLLKADKDLLIPKKYTDSVSLSGSEVDFSLGWKFIEPSVLTVAKTYTFTNIHKNAVIEIITKGNVTRTFPTYVDISNLSSADFTKKVLIQIDVINVDSGSEQAVATFVQTNL